MSCSLNNSRKLAQKYNIIDKYNNLVDNSGQTITKFNKFIAYLKNLALEKFGTIPSEIPSPAKLDGNKVIFNEPFFNWVDGKNIQRESSKFYQKQTNSSDGIIATEKTIRDLAERMSDRIGIPFKIISDRSKEFKGKIDERGRAVINLAYATLDTPIHEILAHPIIRAIKNGSKFQIEENLIEKDADKIIEKNHVIEKNGIRYLAAYNAPDGTVIYRYDKIIQTKPNTELYQNLLKELEYGKGKEVLDRIKRDYVNKEKSKSKNYNLIDKNNNSEIEIIQNFGNYWFKEYNENLTRGKQFNSNEELESLINKEQNKHLLGKYTLEEQQEEAIVELLGLMTAEKLNATKDGKLISLLKRLLKEIKSFVKSILKQHEVEIDKLPDNMTIGDLADLLAYSNSKLILPGYEVEYTTPDNQQFKTYVEASNHISQLAKSVEDVNLESIDIDNNNFFYEGKNYIKKDGKWFYERYESYYKDYNVLPGYKKSEPFVKLNISKGLPIRYDKDVITSFDIQNFKSNKDIQKHIENFIKNNLNVKVEKVLQEIDISNLHFNSYDGSNAANNLQGFIEKNKEYEQSKEIIEEWKKVNNIQYNPEEIYSRGQEFVSVVGAYSDFDVNLMMQNLLQHIEDNEKAGGEFTISAFTKPVDRKIGHLEGGGGKIKFKIYPQSKDIKWAANTDVYSGSVWDASEKVSKDKKSELLGVSYTKYPALYNVDKVQPNLASIIDNLAHHHNELGISLNGTNFRLEYDENIPYQTKKIIDSVNSILDQKYGKLVKPEIEKSKKETILIDNPLPENERSGVLSYSADIGGGYFLDTIYGFERRGYALGDKIYNSKVMQILKIAYPNSNVTYEPFTNKVLVDGKDIVTYSGLKYETPDKIEKEVAGKQPTKTNNNLKRNILDIKSEISEENDRNEYLIARKDYLYNLENAEIKQGHPQGFDADRYFDIQDDFIRVWEKDGKYFSQEMDSPDGEIREITKEQFEKGIAEFGDLKPLEKTTDWYFETPDLFTIYERFDTKEEAEEYKKKEIEKVKKEIIKLGERTTKQYNSQALINIKIAALKESAKKYPLSLIRSEVRPIDDSPFGTHQLFSSDDELPFQKLPSQSVDYQLKAIKALQSDKVRQPNKNFQGFLNDLEKQGVNKEQIELVKQSYKEGDSKEDLITSLLANYSYTVAIETAKDEINYSYRLQREFNGEDYDFYYEVLNHEGEVKFIVDTKEEAERLTKQNGRSTQYYANLTVPGGINYTENNINTPLITPAIKGHAQFSEDTSIGWFRSDEKQDFSEENLKKIEEELGIPRTKFNYQSSEFANGTPTKTRRILEVQSDWGQKQRKSFEPDINVKYDIQQIINDLQKSGDLKIDCN